MKSKNETLQKLVIEAINSGRSQNSLSRSMGISAATMVSLKNGQWDNISEKMVNKCLAYFKVDNWQLMNTWNMDTIQKLCNDTRISKRCVAIAGYTGAGKTTALREYVKHNPHETFMIHATSLMNRKLFLGAIQASMGIRDGFSVPMMCDAVVSQLASCSDPLLIIDDASKLNHAVMLLIQIIYDQTENRAGIILAGTEYLEDVLKRGVNSNRLGFRELYRRISYWQSLRVPTLKAVEMISTNYGINDAACVKYIHEHARNYGDIRNVITNAIKVGEDTGREIDRSLLEGLLVGNHSYNMTKRS